MKTQHSQLELTDDHVLIIATFSNDEIQQSLEQHGGNMREVLMDFYDRVEERRAVAAPKVKAKS